MTAVSVRQMAERISDLLGEVYGVNGDLGARLRKTRRRLPARVRQAVEYLDSASHLATSGRLAHQVDMAQASAAYDLAVKYLRTQDPRDGWRGRVQGVAASAAFALLAVAVLVVIVLRWRGFI